MYGKPFEICNQKFAIKKKLCKSALQTQQIAFTLAGGTFCIEMRNGKSKFGFTLAEVLITLAIIGLVAAMTIPTLIAKINDTVKANQLKVQKARFIEGLNLYNSLDNGLVRTDYANTYEFLQGLSKHFKMSAICDAGNLADCMPYAEIIVEGEDSSQTVDVSSLSSPAKLNLSNDEYLAPAGFITAAGVPYIVALKKGCIEDPDQPLKDYTSCLDGLFDYSGAKSPNTLGKDINPIRMAGIAVGPNCTYTIGSGATAVCMMSAPFIPTATEAQTAGAACSSIVANNGKYSYTENGETKEITLDGVSKCPFPSGDYWLAAKIACAKQGLKLPDLTTLHNLAESIYGQSVTNTFGYANGTTFSTDKTDALKAARNSYGFNILLIWSDSELNSDSAKTWSFDSGETYCGADERNISNIETFCVE